MARTFSEGLSSGLGSLDNAIQRRTLAKRQSLEDAMKIAELQSKGFNVQEQDTPRKLFGFIPAGSQRSLSITPNNQPLPEGFIRVGGEVKPDPSYLNPKEVAQKKALESGFLGVNPSTGESEQQIPTLESLPPETQALIKGVMNYEIDPTKTASVKNNNRQQLISAVKNYDPTYDMSQYDARSNYRKEISGGKIGANVRSFNTAVQHLGELYDSTDKTPSSPIGMIEGGQRYLAQKFASGSPTDKAIQDENAALTAVSGELANIFKNSGGTDQEIEKWFKSYNPNSSRDSKREFIKAGIKLMQGRLGALDSDYERVMGKKNPNSFMSKDSESTIGRINGAQVPAWVPKGFESDYAEARKRGATDDQITALLKEKGLLS